MARNVLAACVAGMMTLWATQAPAAEPASWNTVRGPVAGPARSIGGYARGCVAGAVALPQEGAGFQVIRLSRQRFFGHPLLVDFLRNFGRKMEKAKLGVALVGDMSQPRGGPMSFGHASHQIGLDVDIWLRLDLPKLSPGARENVREVSMVDFTSQWVDRRAWTDAQAEMIRLAAGDPRVSRIFVNPVIKQALCRRDWADRSWLRMVRPWHGHDGHMHVRLNCPADSPACEAQKPLPPGDGCDEAGSWLPTAKLAARPVPANPQPPKMTLPAACSRLLQGGERFANKIGVKSQ
ncbi:MAG TPA: penicillin-insensitive murein endopeptidase [Azospirillaceae bacterium]|nr:penicillin-insensitive murein endopeptidase [Azospirillaceae bacterium]